MEELSKNLKINNSPTLDDSIPQISLGDKNEVPSPINETTSSKQSQASEDDSSNNALGVTKRGGNKRGRTPKASLDPPSAPGREGGGWECSICTFRNSTKTFSCEICGTRKGTSTRKPRLNPNIMIAQRALAGVDKSSTSPPTPAVISISSAIIIDSVKQSAPVAASDRWSSTLKKSELKRGKTPKLKPGPKAKSKQPSQDIITPPEDVDCSFKKNLDLAADTLLLLSSTPSPTSHKPLKKRPTLTPPSPSPPGDRDEPPSSFLATLMMSSLNPATPLPPTDAYLNFLHSWKRRGRTSPPLTPRAPVIVSAPRPSVPLQFCEYLNQFKNPHLTPQPNEAEPSLISGPDPPSVASGSSGMDSEDEMYMTRVVGSNLSAYLTTVSPPKQLVDPLPPTSVIGLSPPTPSKCRKKRWMDRLNGLTSKAEEPPHHVMPITPTALKPPDHVIATRPADGPTRFEPNPLPLVEVMTSLGVVGVKEEGGPHPPNSTRAPNGVIKKTAKLKKNHEETPSPDQYTFDNKAPKTYQVTVNGLTVDITDYPLLTSTPVT